MSPEGPDRIMEKITKNTDDKPRRGRPRTFSPEHVEIMKTFITTTAETGRTWNNILFAVQGIGVVLDKSRERKRLKDPIYSFLYDYGRTERSKKTILSSLGRVAKAYGMEEAETLARVICRERLNTRTALNYINTSRGLRKNSVKGTVDSIISIFNDSYLSPAETLEVLEMVNRTVKNYLNEPGDDKKRTNQTGQTNE